MSDHGGSHDHGHSGGSHGGGGGGFKSTITILAIGAVVIFLFAYAWTSLTVIGYETALVAVLVVIAVFSLAKNNWRITVACLALALFLLKLPEIKLYAQTKLSSIVPSSSTNTQARPFFPEDNKPKPLPPPTAAPPTSVAPPKVPTPTEVPLAPPVNGSQEQPPVSETVTVNGDLAPPPEFTPSDMALQLSDNPWCRYSNPGVIGCYLWIKNNTEKARTVYLRDSSWSDGINAGWIPSATSLHCGDEHRTYICTINPGTKQRILIQIDCGDRDATEVSFDLHYWYDTAGQYPDRSYSNLSLTPGVPE